VSEQRALSVSARSNGECEHVVREVAERTRQVAQAWLKDRENAVANPHFADFRYRDLSTGLIFDRDQIAEIVTQVREKLAS